MNGRVLKSQCTLLLERSDPLNRFCKMDEHFISTNTVLNIKFLTEQLQNDNIKK